MMTITVEATFENGVLKPKHPLALAEGAQVSVAIISSENEHDDPL